jgi:hypothetical protein
MTTYALNAVLRFNLDDFQKVSGSWCADRNPCGDD